MPGGGRAARTRTGSMPLTSARARGSPVTALSVTPAITGSASPWLLLIFLTRLRGVGRSPVPLQDCGFGLPVGILGVGSAWVAFLGSSLSLCLISWHVWKS